MPSFTVRSSINIVKHQLISSHKICLASISFKGVWDTFHQTAPLNPQIVETSNPEFAESHTDNYPRRLSSDKRHTQKNVDFSLYYRRVEVADGAMRGVAVPRDNEDIVQTL